MEHCSEQNQRVGGSGVGRLDDVCKTTMSEVQFAWSWNIRFDRLANPVQWNPDFSNLDGKRKLVREIGSSKYRWLNYSETNPRETSTFGSNYRDFWEIEGSKNLDSTVYTFALRYTSVTYSKFMWACKVDRSRNFGPRSESFAFRR